MRLIYRYKKFQKSEDAMGSIGRATVENKDELITAATDLLCQSHKGHKFQSSTGEDLTCVDVIEASLYRDMTTYETYINDEYPRDAEREKQEWVRSGKGGMFVATQPKSFLQFVIDKNYNLTEFVVVDENSCEDVYRNPTLMCAPRVLSQCGGTTPEKYRACENDVPYVYGPPRVSGGFHGSFGTDFLGVGGDLAVTVLATDAQTTLLRVQLVAAYGFADTEARAPSEDGSNADWFRKAQVALGVVGQQLIFEDGERALALRIGVSPQYTHVLPNEACILFALHRSHWASDRTYGHLMALEACGYYLPDLLFNKHNGGGTFGITFAGL
jgi:hypothetical protein